MPQWPDFRATFKSIFKRRYFANHGPLVRELDARVAELLNVRHAISVTNSTIALMVAAKAMGLIGEVILPSFTFPRSVQAMTWAGLIPVFCDVDPDTHNLSSESIEPLINNNTCAILGVHLWGRACEPDKLQTLCNKYKLDLFFDASHGMNCSYKGVKIGGFGKLETFSFEISNGVNTIEGSCLTTNDDELARRIRTVRNFHLSESFQKVPLRINGKMSEAQAAIVLLYLNKSSDYIIHNKHIFEIYKQHSQNWRGIRMVDTVTGEISNYQHAVFKIDSKALNLDRNQFLVLLNSEGILAKRYFYPGAHRIPPYSDLYPQYLYSLPITDDLCASLIQLPIGANVTPHDIQKISDLIDFIIGHSNEILECLNKGTFDL